MAAEICSLSSYYATCFPVTKQLSGNSYILTSKIMRLRVLKTRRVMRWFFLRQQESMQGCVTLHTHIIVEKIIQIPFHGHRMAIDHQNQSNKTGFIPVLREVFVLRCIDNNRF